MTNVLEHVQQWLGIKAKRKDHFAAGFDKVKSASESSRPVSFNLPDITATFHLVDGEVTKTFRGEAFSTEYNEEGYSIESAEHHLIDFVGNWKHYGVAIMEGRCFLFTHLLGVTFESSNRVVSLIPFKNGERV